MEPETPALLASFSPAELAPFAAMLAIGVISWAVQRHLYPPAPTAPDGEHCAACYEQSLEWTAPGCYRCLACGHEGGEGQADHARAQRQAAIDTWPRERQLAFARQRWQDADRALDEALVVLGTFGTGTALAEFVHTPSDGDWSDEAYFRAGSLAQQAAEALADVAAVHPQAPPFVVPFADAEPGDFGLETQVTIDGRVTTDRKDLATVADLRNARAALVEQHERWRTWWRALEAPET